MSDWSGEGFGKVVKYSNAPIPALVAFAFICAALRTLVDLGDFGNMALVSMIVFIILLFGFLLIFKRDALAPKKEERILWHKERLGDSESEFLYILGQDLPQKASPLIEGGQDKT